MLAVRSNGDRNRNKNRLLAYFDSFFPFIFEEPMNKKQLMALGVPEDCISQAIASVQVAARDKEWEKPSHLLKKLVAAPDLYLSDKYYGDLAASGD